MQQFPEWQQIDRFLVSTHKYTSMQVSFMFIYVQ